VLITQPGTPSALVDPPWLSCQSPCVLHSRRVCFAVARLGPSPLPARLTTAHSCRARPCLCAAKGAAQVCADRKEVTPAAPPNTCCSRPPSRCDFPCRRVPSAGGGLHRRSHRAAAERHRWAGGFLGLRLQLGSSRPASIGSTHEPPCPSHNRARHLRSSARLLTPASHRMHLTHAAYASPSLVLALRLCLHGSARLILAVLGRVEGTAKGIAASVCRLRSCHPGRPAQHSLQPTALSGRFSTTSCADCRLALHVTTRRAAG
jgi:hypothetical protein